MIEVQLWVKVGDRAGSVTSTQVFSEVVFAEQVDAWRAFGFNVDWREGDDEHAYVEVTGEARDLAAELNTLFTDMHNEKLRAEAHAYISNSRWPSFYRDRPAWEEYRTAMQQAGRLALLCRGSYNLCQYVVYDTAWDATDEDET